MSRVSAVHILDFRRSALCALIVATACAFCALLFSPTARAQSDACALLGAFSPASRTQCERAAALAKHVQPPAERPASRPTDASQPTPNAVSDVRSASNPLPTPPSPAGFTRTKVVGNLYVDIAGKYPAGYAAKWQSTERVPTVPAEIRRGNNPPSRSLNGSIGATIGDEVGNGRAWFAFSNSVQNGLCYADFAHTDAPVLITSVPQTFRLTGFHTTEPNRRGASDCSTAGNTKSYSGTATLSADPGGDITMSFTLIELDRDGAVFQRRDAPDYVLKNAMTPQLAVADMERKKQAAIAAARAQVLAQKEAAKEAAEARAEAARLAAMGSECRRGVGRACYELGQKQLAFAGRDDGVAKSYFTSACKLGNKDGCSMLKQLAEIDAAEEAAPRQSHRCPALQHWNALMGYCDNL